MQTRNKLIQKSARLSWCNHKNHYELLKEFYALNKYLISEQFKDTLLDAIECMEYTMTEEGEQYESKVYKDGERNERNI